MGHKKRTRRAFFPAETGLQLNGCEAHCTGRPGEAQALGGSFLRGPLGKIREVCGFLEQDTGAWPPNPFQGLR